MLNHSTDTCRRRLLKTYVDAHFPLSSLPHLFPRSSHPLELSPSLLPRLLRLQLRSLGSALDLPHLVHFGLKKVLLVRAVLAQFTK